MPSQAEARLTPQEYLALDRAALSKSEYFNGEMFAMSGASRRHNLISLNIGAELRAQLRHRPCEVYTSDMRVKIRATGLYTYPDVVVVCAEPAFEDTAGDTLLNPTVLVEVLSKSTADYDRGGKFEHYRTLPSLQEYLLVAQEQPHVVQYVRQSDTTWLLSEVRGLEAHLHLPSITCDLALSEVYAKVRFDA
jgi:Uma2 family endonuclease